MPIQEQAAGPDNNEVSGLGGRGALTDAKGVKKV